MEEKIRKRLTKNRPESNKKFPRKRIENTAKENS